MSERFRHEDVSAVPAGWKTRTVTHGDHRVRVAFPPGRRHKGSGRLVSILHPLKGHNPCTNGCTMRSSNPAELLIMGANPPRGRKSEARRNAKESESVYKKIFKCPHCSRKFSAYEVEAGDYRKHLSDHRAERFGQKNPSELLVMGANPRVEVVHGDNPPVEEIHEAFTGQEVKWIDVYNEPHIPRGRYAQLGPLLALYIKPMKAGQVQRITFSKRDQPLIVTDSTARQIYFVGGNQDISDCVSAFTDEIAGRVSLGQGRRIDYQCRKEHVAHPEEDLWKHDHGEEDGKLPTVLFDTNAKRLLYEGGNYRIEGPWIHN